MIGRLGNRGRAWAVGAAVYAVAVFIAGSIDVPTRGPEYDDKLAHLLVFGGQYLVVSHARAAAGATRRGQVLGGAVTAFSLGAALEAWQALLPHRSADFADLVADTLGVFGAAVGEELVRRVRRTA